MIRQSDALAVAATLNKLAHELNAEFVGGPVLFFRGGKKFEINLYPSVRSGTASNKLYIPARFELKTAIESPHPKFKVKLNTPFDRITERILQRHDFQTGDRQFDAQAYIEISDVTWATGFFSDSEVRSSVSELFRNGFHRLYSQNDMLVLDLFVKTSDRCPSKDRIEKVVKEMNFVLGRFPTDYICATTCDKDHVAVFKYSLYELSKDILAANDEFLYGDLDQRSINRMKVIAVVVAIALAVAIWRLFTHIKVAGLLH